MNRDAFMLLAMGFTGPKALRWKLRYIEAFNAMEDRLRNHPALPDASIRAELEHLRAEIASLRLALPKPRYADKPDRLVLRFIRSRDIMPRGVLSRKVDGRLSPDELDDVCERLEEEGEIEIIRRPSDPVRGGRPGTWYVPV
jgi:anti-sigma factor RsiW